MSLTPSHLSSLVPAFADMLKECHSVVLTCHANVDGDALGSTLGLRQVLINMGKKATVITPDKAPGQYKFIKGFRSLECYESDRREACDQLIDEADLVIMMDFNSLSRINASLGGRLASVDKKKIVVDHHLDPDIKADLLFSHPEASATCELIYRIICDADFDQYVDVNAASNFYIGIMTDTGLLSYNSNNPEIYELVARLLRKGINKPALHTEAFQNRKVHQLRLQGYAVCHKLHRVEKNSPLCYMALSDAELQKFNYHSGDTEGIVNKPLEVGDIMVSCLMTERPMESFIHMSFRSKGSFPVNEFSNRYFHGGGHLNAAGGKHYGSLDEAVELYRSKIAEFYKEWSKQSAK